jgi:hypothetical protein
MSEYTANIELAKPVPTWQKPSICKRTARGISLAYRIKKLLGII